jgi:hypothetical protein
MPHGGSILFSWRTAVGTAPIKLHATFSDNMVLQRAQPVPLWGTGNAHAEVRISIADRVVTTPVAEDAGARNHSAAGSRRGQE